jgi:thioredoxin 1
MAGIVPEAAKENESSWPERALDLSADDIEGVLHRFNVVVIDCWVGWCKHSKRMLPIFEAMAKDMTGKVVFGKVDAQLDFHFPVQYKVKATPTFLIFKKGELVDRLIGEQSREELEHALRRQLDLLPSEPSA